MNVNKYFELYSKTKIGQTIITVIRYNQSLIDSDICECLFLLNELEQKEHFTKHDYKVFGTCSDILIDSNLANYGIYGKAEHSLIYELVKLQNRIKYDVYGTTT